MHISVEDLSFSIISSGMDYDCAILNSQDDQLSCIAKQITSSNPLFISRPCVKTVSIKGKYEYLGKANPISSDSQKELSTNSSHSEEKLAEAKTILWNRSKVSLGWSTSHPRGCGMMNLGNTCYMNSSLQALFHIPAMANWLLEEYKLHVTGCETNSSYMGFCSICAMMRTIHLTINTSANAIKPALLHNRLKCIGKSLQYDKQEDAHEFIKLLLDHMQRSYLMTSSSKNLDHRSRETTPIHQIFGGYLRQQVICPNCQNVSTTFSHFQDLVLDISSVENIDDALRQYFQKETLDYDNAYKCENCRRRVQATKRSHIETIPNVLLLQLKRFSLSGGKITKHIAVQGEISINNYVWNNKGECKYKLVSMVNHLGSSQYSGHYTAICKSSNENMYEFDDNTVRFVHMDNALHKNPYVLFYELVNVTTNNKMKKTGKIQVQSKNGCASKKKSKASKVNSQPGGSGLSKKGEQAKINGHCSMGLNGTLGSLNSNRNKISFEIKMKSDKSNLLMNGSRSSISTDMSYLDKNNVNTWDGRPSNTFESKVEYTNKRSAHDMYNDEYDVGKVSKKKFKYDKVQRQDNPFQSYQNRQQNDGGYRPRGMWSGGYRYNNHYGNKRNFHSNGNFKSHGSYGGNYHRNSYQKWHYRGGNQGYNHYKSNRA